MKFATISTVPLARESGYMASFCDRQYILHFMNIPYIFSINILYFDKGTKRYSSCGIVFEIVDYFKSLGASFPISFIIFICLLTLGEFIVTIHSFSLLIVTAFAHLKSPMARHKCLHNPPYRGANVQFVRISTVNRNNSFPQKEHLFVPLSILYTDFILVTN